MTRNLADVFQAIEYAAQEGGYAASHSQDVSGFLATIRDLVSEATKMSRPVVHIKDPLKMWTPDDEDGTP